MPSWVPSNPGISVWSNVVVPGTVEIAIGTKLPSNPTKLDIMFPVNSLKWVLCAHTKLAKLHFCVITSLAELPPGLAYFLMASSTAGAVDSLMRKDTLNLFKHDQVEKREKQKKRVDCQTNKEQARESIVWGFAHTWTYIEPHSKKSQGVGEMDQLLRALSSCERPKSSCPNPHPMAHNYL